MTSGVLPFPFMKRWLDFPLVGLGPMGTMTCLLALVTDTDLAIDTSALGDLGGFPSVCLFS